MAAGPSDFFDPFFESVEPDSPPDHELPSESVDSRAREGPRGPGLYTTWDPQQLIGRKAAVDSRKNLLIRGQGTIAVLSDARDRLLFSIKTDTAGAPTLYLDIGRSECRMYYKRHSVSKPMSIALDVAHGRPEDAPYLWSGKPTIYWLSIDKCNGILRYGKHYTNVAHTLLLAKLKKKGKDEKSGDDGVMVWINPKKNAWLEGLRTVEVIQDNGESPKKTKINPEPVVLDRSPFVISDQRISLQQLESNQYTVPANLPTACQILYQNVAGPNIVLNSKEFPDFADAIQRSVSTKGLWGYKKLRAKAHAFGKEEFNSTYLRITIGTNLGNSPGVPYVLEIWPYGHYSPIHDHGKACAIIKVLCGDIRATYYDTLESAAGPQRLAPPIKLREGDITWLGDENYQIHKLENMSLARRVCCTIQSYMYPEEDKEHYESFNYVTDEHKESEPFTPNSDATFTEFYTEMQREWQLYRAAEGDV
ncbi:hypothetical protein MMC16_005525 [Acarospora aff. strigata]|nr:hypothetical protein [Acarospora aff. strigata]